MEDKEKYVILDTETTGLAKDSVIIQISIMDLDGKTILDTLVKPVKGNVISKFASAVHGILSGHLSGSPTFTEIRDKVAASMAGKNVLIYNKSFDLRMIEQTCTAEGCDQIHIVSTCVMKQYSKFIGEWNESRHNYRWQKLPGGDHSSLGDCRATLKILKQMAETNLTES